MAGKCNLKNRVDKLEQQNRSEQSCLICFLIAQAAKHPDAEALSRHRPHSLLDIIQRSYELPRQRDQEAKEKAC